MTEHIRGYKLKGDFCTAGGGRCRWTLCTRGEEEFFLKEFLAPKYPVSGSPGSPATRARKQRECDQFEKRHLALKKAIDHKVGKGGNLVKTLDFFRENTTYYKVTETVDVADAVTPEAISRLSRPEILIIARALCHSVNILHSLEIVHGDLKPDNVLIKHTSGGRYTAKLIDFDDSYFIGEPPPAGEIVGDQTFYSPELAEYIMTAEEADDPGPEWSRRLQPAGDNFALALILHSYCTGELPGFDRRTSHYPWEAVRKGEKLRISDEIRVLGADAAQLVARALGSNPAERPTAEHIFKAITIEDKKPGTSGPSGPKKPGGLIGKLSVPPKKPEAPPEPPPLKPTDSASSGKLRGTLVKKDGG